MRQDGAEGNDYASEELVSLTREQLQILQQLNLKVDADKLNSSSSDMDSYSSTEVESLLKSLQQYTKDSATNLYNKTLANPQLSTSENKTMDALNRSQAVTQAIVPLAEAGGNLLLGMTGVGLVGSIAGGAIIGAYLSGASKESKKRDQYFQYAMKYSSNFIDMTESDNRRGLSGLSVDSAADFAEKAYKLTPKLKISDDQMQQLVMTLTENGTLRSADDVDSAIAMVERYGKTAIKMMTLLNTTIEYGAQLFAQFDKLGISDSSISLTAAQSNLASAFLGVDSQTLMQSTLNATASMTSGTGIQAQQISSSISQNNLVGGMMFSSLDKADEENMTYEQRQTLTYINNIGRENVGAEITQLSQNILQSDFSAPFLASMYKFNEESGQLEYDKSATNIMDEKSLSEIGAIATSNLQEAGITDPSAVTEFMNTAGDRVTNDLSSLSQVQIIRQIVEAISKQSEGRLSETQILKDYFGMDTEQAALMDTYLGIDQNNLNSVLAISTIQDTYATTRAENPGGIFGNIRSAWTSLKQSVYAPFLAISSGIEKFGTNLSQSIDALLWGDNYYAADYITQTDFWNIDEEDKISRAEAWNQIAKNASDTLNSLSDDAYLQIASAMGEGDEEKGSEMLGEVTSALSEGFFDIDNIKETNYGLISSESFNWGAISDASQLNGSTIDEIRDTADLIRKGKFNNLEDVEDTEYQLEMMARDGVVTKSDQYSMQVSDWAKESGYEDLSFDEKVDKFIDSALEQEAALDEFEIAQGNLDAVFSDLEKVGDRKMDYYEDNELDEKYGDHLSDTYKTAKDLFEEYESRFGLEDGTGISVVYKTDDEGNIDMNEGISFVDSGLDLETMYKDADEGWKITNGRSEAMQFKYEYMSGIIDDVSIEAAEDLADKYKKYMRLDEETKQDSEYTTDKDLMRMKTLAEAGITDSKTGVGLGDLLENKNDAQMLTDEERLAAIARLDTKTSTVSENILGDVMDQQIASAATEDPTQYKIMQDVQASREYLKVIAKNTDFIFSGNKNEKEASENIQKIEEAQNNNFMGTLLASSSL